MVINITNYTKNGLLLFIISTILSVVSSILMFSTFFSFDSNSISNENFSFIFLLIPSTLIYGIGALLAYIGAILFLVGRKEFGEKHRKFVTYALIVFVVSIVVNFFISPLIGFMAFSSVFSSMSTGSTEQLSTFYSNSYIYTALLVAPIGAIIGGLIWVLGLYQLENYTGKISLFGGYFTSIATSFGVTFYSYQNLVNSDLFSSSFSSSLSYYQWFGNIGIISISGALISSLFYLFALYIPYQRIKTGEMEPVQQPKGFASMSSRICPNCNQPIPFDANVCPYCGKKFKNFL